jgi:hypothetical protein
VLRLRLKRFFCEKACLKLENLAEEFKFLQSTSTLNQISLPFSWRKPSTEQRVTINVIAVQTEISETPPTAPSIHLSESLSLNDIVYRLSRFELFIASSRKMTKDVSGGIKDGLSRLV